MPGIGAEIDGAIQHIPQEERHFINLHAFKPGPTSGAKLAGLN